MKAWFTLAITCVLGLALTGAQAVAAPPAVIAKNEVVTSSFPVDFCEFAVQGDYVVRRTLTEYYGEHGKVVRFVFNIRFEGTLTNTATGTSVRSTGHRLIVDDVRRERTIEAGVQLASAPGTGVVLLDAGRLVFDWNGTPDNFDDDELVFVAGPHEELSGETAELCATLAAT